uniref:Uncharacterized protein n=1 Tax=Aegilops tauschii subsp. strangulata TaxID=200361 RepID=A0A453II84_AEGTS
QTQIQLLFSNALVYDRYIYGQVCCIRFADYRYLPSLIRYIV